MADTVFTIAEETQNWLNIRASFRLTQRQAYLGTLTVPGDKPPTPPAEDGVTNQQATEYACQVVHNNFFSLILPGMYQEDQSTYGWPPTADLTKKTLDLLASPAEDSKRPAYSELIRRQLQINTLESFRRTLLSQRQRKKHLIRHQQQAFLAEPQAKAELEALLQNIRVGQTAAPTVTDAAPAG